MRVAISFGVAASFPSRRARRRRASPGRSPACGARTRRACRRAGRRGACARRRARPCQRCAGGAPGVSTSAGISNGARVQPSFSRAPSISSAPSGEPCALDLPALVGAPKPIVVLQAIMRRPVGRLRLLDRGRDGVGIMAVDARRRSSRRPRSASPDRPSRTATAGRRSRCRCRRTARSAC